MAEPRIHPTAIVDPAAQLGDDVRIGPYCIVGGECVLGQGVVLRAHVVVAGRTAIGEKTEVWPFTSLGSPPQDLKYAGEKSSLEIGARNRIREHVTMNPGTSGGGMVTRVGSGGLFMVGVHIAHDCQVGDHVVMANNATLAGHVSVGDHVVIGGLSAVHQFTRIGAHAIIGAGIMVRRDVVPYAMLAMDCASRLGVNSTGMRRRSFSRSDVKAARAAIAAVADADVADGALLHRLEKVVAEHPGSAVVQEIAHFAGADSKRGLAVGREAG